MIEGELLEVSLSETQDLWRILAAANPQVSSIDYSNNNYNILVIIFIKFKNLII